jgi:hypothetical protein
MECETLIFQKLNFYRLLTEQWDFQVIDEQSRIPRFDSYAADWFLEKSIFIGFQLTDRVSHEMEVIFGFAMLDYPVSLVTRAKMRLSGSMQKLTKLEVRCTTCFKS